MITLGLQDYAVADKAGVAQSSSEGASSIAPPLTAADRGRRGGDLPYAYIDPRWLRSYLPTRQCPRETSHPEIIAMRKPPRSTSRPILSGLESTPRWARTRPSSGISGPRGDGRINTSKRLTWQGLQWLIVRSVMVTGEAFIVMRRRRMNDRARPHSTQHVEIFRRGRFERRARARNAQPVRRSTRGREIGPNGRVLAWHFRVDAGFLDRYVRVPASDVVHVYDP